MVETKISCERITHVGKQTALDKQKEVLMFINEVKNKLETKNIWNQEASSNQKTFVSCFRRWKKYK